MADEEERKLAESPEMSTLLRVLAIVNANVLERVKKAETLDRKIARAEVETKRLMAEENLAGNHKCPKGTIWDESLRRCVPIG